MSSHPFGNYGGGGGGGRDGIDPNDIIPGSYASPSFSSHNFNSPNPTNPSAAFSSGSAIFGDDELLDGLGSPTDTHAALPSHGHDFRALDMNNMAFSPDGYGSHTGTTGLHLGHNHLGGYSNTPDGEPIQSPYQQNFTGGPFRQALGTSLHSPISYAGSPHGQSDIHPDGGEYLGAKQRRSVPAPVMQRKTSAARSPATPKTSMHGLPIGPHDGTGFGPQPIHTSGMHEKASSTPWMHTPGGSLGASFGSGFSSPIQPSMMPMNEVMMKGGTSMPTKLGAASGAVTSQEAKRKRRRESHNAVERRRRDNINERIQDLSGLVPSHRLEDEKMRKLIQNGTPLSPTLGSGMSKPSQATSGLAGPGTRRATGVTAGNITTGLPVEDKDKGPNKGDILNGAVGWMRDLMWMLHLKLQQQDELANYIAELGGSFPYQVTDDERRMQSELSATLSRHQNLSYSRTAGSTLRVPGHTDYRGDPLDGSSESAVSGINPDIKDHGSVIVGDMDDIGQPWHDPAYWTNQDDEALQFKEEDEYDMDLTQ